MSKEFLPISSVSDSQSWNMYKNTEHRWTFNKLELALLQGLHAGPAAVPPEKEGWYIQRPTYNLYGLGIEAKKFFYHPYMFKRIINHDLIPPGNFWCEWVEGDQFSLNYRKTVHGKWHLVSVWRGVLFSDENLTKFNYWEKVSLSHGIPPEKLPYFVNWLDDEKTTCFNIEIKGGKIIEIHLRSGDEIEDNFEINDKIFPIWVDEDNDYIKNIEEPDPEMTLFKAHGHLSIVRDGFHLEKSNKDTC